MPYTRADVASLKAWAYGQPTAAARTQADVLLALGLGAGCTAADIAALVVDDIVVDEQGVLVQLAGERPREVPVLFDYERPLAGVVEAGHPPGTPVFLPGRRRSKNLITGFTSRGGGEPGPNTHRMRSTWIVEHLVADVPIAVLMKAAGVDTVQGLTRYLAHIPDTDALRARAALRGTARGRA
ncbi:hypothetical protein [Nocardia alni]|uniref:hypothetical protein n=1 Tax=Nocardia alni TaxID=2815723 RepID=UPI001C2379E1|nr:hypothetical protein [Nocardia alni]